MGKSFDFTQHGWDQVTGRSPGESTPLKPGVYLCSIIKADAAVSRAGREMFVLFLDIAEGEFAGHFRKIFNTFAKKDAAPKWSNNATYRQLIFDNNNFISPFCKNLLEVVAEADSNFKINPANFNSDDLIGKRCPFLFVAEEYSYNGEVKTRVAVDKPIHFADFKAGNVVIPQTKKIDNFSYSTPHTNNSNDPLQGTPVANEDLPF